MVKNKDILEKLCDQSSKTVLVWETFLQLISAIIRMEVTIMEWNAGFLSLVPAILAIACALITKEVVFHLFWGFCPERSSIHLCRVKVFSEYLITRYH